jgi:hypothetical protein
MTIILLRNKKLFCLHLKMKRMLNRKLMLEWMRTKSCEEEGSVFRVLCFYLAKPLRKKNCVHT